MLSGLEWSHWTQMALAVLRYVFFWDPSLHKWYFSCPVVLCSLWDGLKVRRNTCTRLHYGTCTWAFSFFFFFLPALTCLFMFCLWLVTHHIPSRSFPFDLRDRTQCGFFLHTPHCWLFCFWRMAEIGAIEPPFSVDVKLTWNITTHAHSGQTTGQT